MLFFIYPKTKNLHQVFQAITKLQASYLIFYTPKQQFIYKKRIVN